MTESEYSGKIVKYLRDMGNLTFKHCDRFTRAIPDVSSTGPMGTAWMEMKYLKRGEQFYDRAMEKKDQYFNMLALSSLSRAFYVMGRGDKTWIFNPKIFMKRATNDELEQLAKWEGTRLPELSDLAFRPVVIPINDYGTILRFTRDPK